jgi:hypothetical protein
LVLLLLASWLNTTGRHNYAVLSFAAVSGVALYTPGGVWFVLLVVVLLAGVLGEHFKQAHAAITSAAAALFLLLAGALGFALWRDTSLLRPWLGIPATFASPLVMLKQWLGSVSYLAVRGPTLGGNWLAHTPVLDIATTALVIFGAYLYRKHLRHVRTRLLLAFFILGSLLVALNGAIVLGFVVSAVYLVSATGVAYFQHHWFKVFPHNPVARTVAIGLMVALTLAIVSYHTQRYFVAWQRSPATQAIFQGAARPDLLQ